MKAIRWLVLGSLLATVLSCSRSGGVNLVSPSAPVEPTPPERGTVGNGSDDIPAEVGSAWFLGPRPIRYCIQVADGFGMEAEKVRETTAIVFRSWKQYLVDSDVGNSYGYRNRMMNMPVPLLVLNTEAMVRCDGTEDLAFYFGIKNPTIERFRRSYVNPLAFSQRLSFDLDAGWSKGFIWLASASAIDRKFPDWRGAPVILEQTLLHEIGHVLGCGHVANSVMDAHFVQSLMGLQEVYLQGNQRERALLDLAHGPDDLWSRKLMACETCEISESPAVFASGPYFLSHLLAKPPTDLMGFGRGILRAPRGILRGFQLEISQVNRNGEKWIRRIEVTNLRRIFWEWGDGQIFRVVFRRGDVLGSGISSVRTHRYLATAKGDMDGGSLEVFLTFNGDEGGLLIQRTDGDPNYGMHVTY